MFLKNGMLVSVRKSSGIFCPRSAAPPGRYAAAAAAFSLVEVVLSLGICSFALIALVGMIPVGLSTFREAIDTTAQSQIVQQVSSEILLTDYSNLEERTYYFDDQLTITHLQSKNLAYTAKVKILPAAELPTETSGRISGRTATAVRIRIAPTHPGQSFDQVERIAPNQVYASSVIVADLRSPLHSSR